MAKTPLTDEEKKERKEVAFRKRQDAIMQATAAHQQSLNKHALIVQAFGGYIVNLFAYLNVAVFTGFTAYVATSVGQQALDDYYKVCLTAFILSVTGLLLSLGLMASVTHYSRNKFDHYRALLLGTPTADSEVFKYISIIVVTILVPVTIFGVAFSTGVVMNTHLPKTSPATETQGK